MSAERRACCSAERHITGTASTRISSSSSFYLLLLERQTLLEEAAEGGAIDVVLPLETRTSKRHAGSHATDCGCSHLRLGVLRDARPRTCLERLLSPWG